LKHTLPANPHFFFLPASVAAPAHTGVFDPSQPPSPRRACCATEMHAQVSAAFALNILMKYNVPVKMYGALMNAQCHGRIFAVRKKAAALD
jgi:hypothetical protein